MRCFAFGRVGVLPGRIRPCRLHLVSRQSARAPRCCTTASAFTSIAEGYVAAPIAAKVAMRTGAYIAAVGVALLAAPLSTLGLLADARWGPLLVFYYIYNSTMMPILCSRVHSYATCRRPAARSPPGGCGSAGCWRRCSDFTTEERLWMTARAGRRCGSTRLQYWGGCGSAPRSARWWRAASAPAGCCCWRAPTPPAPWRCTARCVQAAGNRWPKRVYDAAQRALEMTVREGHGQPRRRRRPEDLSQALARTIMPQLQLLNMGSI